MTAKASPRETQFYKRIRKLLGSETECQDFFRSLDELVQEKSHRRAFRVNRLRDPEERGDLQHFKDWNLESVQKLTISPETYEASFTQIKNLGEWSVLGSGRIYIQEKGAQLAAELLAPQPGEVILDLCAAPGAKASHIGERLKGQGWLVANEPVRPRAERLDVLLSRQGVANCSVYALDPSSLAEKFPRFFDAVLVDAPCTGESLFAKRQEKRKDVGDREVEGSARRQRIILLRAAEMTRPEGRILYSTCTYSREENEDVIAAFLDQHPGWKLIEEKRLWPHKDATAGGYYALLKNTDAPEARPILNLDGNEGLIRHGPLKWNREWDLYALAMAPFSFAENRHSKTQLFFDLIESAHKQNPRPEFEDVEISMSQASLYLRGSAISLNSFNKKMIYQRATHDSYPLGPAKFVESRLNNLLPRVLRAL